jgi:hypothetical protein
MVLLTSRDDVDFHYLGGKLLFAMFSFLDYYDVQFWVTGLKDVMSILVISGIVTYTQFGIYNRCDCYIHSGKVGLQLLDMPQAKGDLEWRLVHLYPYVMRLGLRFSFSWFWVCLFGDTARQSRCSFREMKGIVIYVGGINSLLDGKQAVPPTLKRMALIFL